MRPSGPDQRLTRASAARACVGACAVLALLLGCPPVQAEGLDGASRLAASTIDAAGIRATVRFLASDLLEGRAPGTRGDTLAQAYLASRLEALGLEAAGAPGKGYLEPLELVGLRASLPRTVAFEAAGKRLALEVGRDVVAFSGDQREVSELSGAELVFVGYGITAPEERWDDYKGADVRGKVVVVLNDDPSREPARFGGRTRTYYGRYSYKFEEALRHGAIGVLVVHTDASAGYGWHVVAGSWWREDFELPRDRKAPALTAKGWLSEAAARRVATLGGHDLEALRARAERDDFRVVPLGVRVSLRIQSTLSRRFTANVVARLPGRDRALAAEAVVIAAHHDHLGVGDPRKGDRIYNGAWDNASGVAGVLAIARALKALPEPPRRSVLLVLTAAEESGLLGSKHWVRSERWLAGRVAAAINVDGLNVWGRTRDLGFVGLGRTSLDPILSGVARALGRTLRGDPAPELGLFYRSDQLSFARAGIPVVAVEPGHDFLGRAAGYGIRLMETFEAERYHQPQDELTDDWNLEGAVEDLRFLFHAVRVIADAPALPTWRAGDEFEATRAAAIQRARATPPTRAGDKPR